MTGSQTEQEEQRAIQGDIEQSTRSSNTVVQSRETQSMEKGTSEGSPTSKKKARLLSEPDEETRVNMCLFQEFTLEIVKSHERENFVSFIRRKQEVQFTSGNLITIFCITLGCVS